MKHRLQAYLLSSDLTSQIDALLCQPSIIKPLDFVR